MVTSGNSALRGDPTLSLQRPGIFKQLLSTVFLIKGHLFVTVIFGLIWILYLKNIFLIFRFVSII